MLLLFESSSSSISLQKNSHNVRTRRLEFVRQMTMIWSTNCDFSQVLESSCPSASPILRINVCDHLSRSDSLRRNSFGVVVAIGLGVGILPASPPHILREGIVLLPTSKFQDRSPASASLEERGCLSSGAEAIDLISPKAKRRAD